MCSQPSSNICTTNTNILCPEGEGAEEGQGEEGEAEEGEGEEVAGEDKSDELSMAWFGRRRTALHLFLEGLSAWDLVFNMILVL